MLGWPAPRQSQEAQAPPAGIYIPLVDSLFSDARTLFVGSIGASIAALVTAWKTGEVLLLACAIAIALVTLARCYDMRVYARQRARIVTIEAARLWERRYAFGASAYVALLGFWCLVSFVKTSDPVAHLFSLSVTISYMIGISGRNFGSQSLVMAQIACASVPITLGLLLVGDVYYTIFACIFVLFFVSLKFISDRLRQTLLDALVASRDVALLASRFDTALNNMPHGLCMFDAERRLVVSNRRTSELLGTAADAARQHPTVRDLARDCVTAGLMTEQTAERFAIDFESQLSGNVTGEQFIEVLDGRTLALTFQPMESGGSVVLIEDITERKNAEAKINHLARYDALTGLPNRTFFRDQMDRILATMRRSGPCAVHFVDLDEFKQVNDTMGHPCGDELLCAVAERLRRLVRDTDVVARFAGDEFVVLQAPVRRPDEAATLAKRIVEVLGEPYEIDGQQVVIGASIGIAMAPRDGVDADHLMKNADMALYRAKADGRGAWRFFEADMDVKAQARRSLELDLRTALAEEAFEVYYQPLINLKTRHISTCEALLRWPHPERGMISPAEFIPVAEEMGLIVDIGTQVLRKACLECAKWPSEVRVAVNFSPIQFKRGNLAAVIRDALAAANLPPDRLEVEITESVLLHDTEATRVALHQLRELGVRISLDDFGTGYSSLSYLHSFPLHKVKIDRSFLKGIGVTERPLTLLRGVARLSADLGMEVVVEGVETEEQLTVVAGEASVNEAQGFLFSKPIPARGIRKLLYASTSQFGEDASPMERVA